MSDKREPLLAGEALLPAVTETAEELYDEAPCGYLSTHEDGTIARVNATFLRWTGYRREDLVGLRRFHHLLSPGGRIYHETHYGPMLRMQGSVREIAVDIVRADGTLLPALINSTLKRDESGMPLAIRTMIFDATERRRYEQELLAERKRAQASEERARTLARTLQESLMPHATPHIPGLDVAARYRPAGTGDAVGGDFYDAFEARDGDWVVLLGDVSGKGADAARVTAAARYTLRAAAMRTPSPRLALGLLNETLLTDSTDRFCTVAYARIARDGDRVRVTISVAGHPLPILLAKGRPPGTAGAGGPPAGLLQDVSFDETSIDLAPGESLIFYTDGVPEGRRDDGEFYGEERLVALAARLAGRSANEVCDTIEQDVVNFQNGQPRDDIAVLVLGRPLPS